MIDWIRIATKMTRDPCVVGFGEALGVRTPEAAGLLLGVLAALPDHCPTGQLCDIGVTTLALWSQWHGDAAQFAAEFRARFCDDDGIVREWDDYNGAPIRSAQGAADRKRKQRQRLAQQEAESAGHVDVPLMSHGTLSDKMRTRRDVTGRNETELQLPQAQRVREQLPESDREAFDRVLSLARFAPTFLAEVESCTNGLNGVAATWVQVGTALRDLATNGGAPTGVALRSFVKRAQSEARAPATNGLVPPFPRFKSADERNAEKREAARQLIAERFPDAV